MRFPFIWWFLIGLLAFGALYPINRFFFWLGMQGFGGWILAALVSVTIFFLIDRGFLFLERLGWIYYRQNKAANSHVTSGVLLAINPIEPEKQYLVETKQEEKKEWINEAEENDEDLNDPRLRL